MKEATGTQQTASSQDQQNNRYKQSKSWACPGLHSSMEERVSLRPNSIDSSTLSLFGFQAGREMSQVSQSEVTTYRQRVPYRQQPHPLHNTYQAVESLPVLRICFIILVVVAIWLIRSDFITTREAKKHEIEMSIDKCRSDYAINRCDNPTENLEQKCEQWQKCFKKDPNHEISNTEIFVAVVGKTVKVFFESLGLVGVLGVVVYLLANRCSRTNEPKRKLV